VDYGLKNSQIYIQIHPPLSRMLIGQLKKQVVWIGECNLQQKLKISKKIKENFH